MKSLKIFALSLACAALLTACGEDDKVIPAEQLPEVVKTYIEKNYADKNIVYVKKDAELFETTYEVAFDDGMKVEFDEDGQVIDIDVND